MGRGDLLCLLLWICNSMYMETEEEARDSETETMDSTGSGPNSHPAKPPRPAHGQFPSQGFLGGHRSS